MNIDALRRVTIGTGEDCELRITTDPYISGHHATIWTDQTGKTWVMDLGSTNGTYLISGNVTAPVYGGTRTQVIGPTRIRPGDTVIVGRTPIPWTPTQ